MTAILEVKELNISYGPVQALNNISLKVEKGAIVALVGANGAGKSTLMKAILGIVKPKSGDIFFQSNSILKMNSHQIVQAGISQSPEGRQIFADMTVYENLLLGIYAKKQSQTILNKKLEQIYDYFPILKARAKQMGMTLSGGEQQMLAIGRALMMEPQLLLLDEPSLGISPLLTEKIFDLFVTLQQQGTSILLAEQNANMALQISNYGYVLELGKIVFEDAANNLLANDLVRKIYLGV